MAKSTKSEIIEALKEFGVISNKNLPNVLQEYGVVSKNDLPSSLKEYGVLTKNDLPSSLKEYGVVNQKDLKELATKHDLVKLERSLTIKITKSKNDLAEIIANIAIAKEERKKVETIERRVVTLENFVYS